MCIVYPAHIKVSSFLNVPVKVCKSLFLYLTARIFRDKTGVFHLSPKQQQEGSEEKQTTKADGNLSNQLDAAMAEVRVLRARLAEKDVKIEELESEKTDLVRSKNQTNQRMEAMVEEKKDLLHTLKYLQEELVKSGKK